MDTSRYTLAIHGGAGNLSGSLPKELAQAYTSGLHQSMAEGLRLLKTGACAVEAVLAAVVVLEDKEVFNAGKGAVFNCAETHQLSASIMNGADGSCGAIANARHCRNPILVADAVRTGSPHNVLAGSTADEFAAEQELHLASNDYFSTGVRREQLRRTQQAGTVTLDHDDSVKGTVGAVAMDTAGNVAAATSTGGMVNQSTGRVSDTALIGAGTYANNRTCAVSVTGHGERFIETVAAHSIHARMLYGKETLHEASAHFMNDELPRRAGGVIAVNARGEAVLAFNTSRMYRAAADQSGWLCEPAIV